MNMPKEEWLMWTYEFLILVAGVVALALVAKQRPQPRQARAIAPRPRANSTPNRRY